MAPWRARAEEQLSEIEKAARHALACLLTSRHARAPHSHAPWTVSNTNPSASARARNRRDKERRFLELAISQVAFARAALTRQPHAARGMYHALMAASFRGVGASQRVAALHARAAKQAPLQALTEVNRARQRVARDNRTRCRALARPMLHPTAENVRRAYARRYPSRATPSRRTISRYLLN